jgi:putative acetyltransferase
VLVGDPVYYCRFGFLSAGTLMVPEVPPQYCLSLRFTPNDDGGTVRFHEAFRQD